MRSFDEPGKFGSWNEGDITRPSTSNDYRVLLINHLVEYGSQMLAETRVRRFDRHRSSNTLYRIPVRIVGL